MWAGFVLSLIPDGCGSVWYWVSRLKSEVTPWLPGRLLANVVKTMELSFVSLRVCVCVLENHSPAVELLRVLFPHQMEAMGNGSVLKKKRWISVIGLRYKILHVKCVLTASKNLKPPGLTCSTALDQVVGENWLTYLVEYVWNTFFFFSNSDVHLLGQSDAFKKKKTSPWKKIFSQQL